MRSLPLISLALLLASACGGDDGESIAFDQLPGRLAETFCHLTFRCCDATEIMEDFDGIDPPITTEEQCVTTLTALYQGFLDQDEAVMAGRLAYHGDAAAACLARVDAAACGVAAQAAQDSCNEGVFVGLVATGGQCKNAGECASANTECSGATSTQFGTCVVLPGVGAACTGSCVEGAYCDFDTDVCAAVKANGAMCTFSYQCDSGNCDDTSHCAAVVPSTRCDGV